MEQARFVVRPGAGPAGLVRSRSRVDCGARCRPAGGAGKVSQPGGPPEMAAAERIERGRSGSDLRPLDKGIEIPFISCSPPDPAITDFVVVQDHAFRNSTHEFPDVGLDEYLSISRPKFISRAGSPRSRSARAPDRSFVRNQVPVCRQLVYPLEITRCSAIVDCPSHLEMSEWIRAAYSSPIGVRRCACRRASHSPTTSERSMSSFSGTPVSWRRPANPGLPGSTAGRLGGLHGGARSAGRSGAVGAVAGHAVHARHQRRDSHDSGRWPRGLRFRLMVPIGLGRDGLFEQRDQLREVLLHRFPNDFQVDPGIRPGTNSTSTSMSLSVPKSARSAEPKRASRRMPCVRQNAASSALGIESCEFMP